MKEITGEWLLKEYLTPLGEDFVKECSYDRQEYWLWYALASRINQFFSEEENEKEK